uniref:Uncharacterized protein n=1 Tax=Romanomermis culicivorax TaxID=13658 RepID=A0A915KGE8_ROMCU
MGQKKENITVDETGKIKKKNFLQTKKAIGDFNRTSKATGGGPPPEPVADIYVKVFQLIPAQLERITCSIDSDAQMTSIFLEGASVFSTAGNSMDIVTLHESYPACKQAYFHELLAEGFSTARNSTDAVIITLHKNYPDRPLDELGVKQLGGVGADCFNTAPASFLAVGATSAAFSISNAVVGRSVVAAGRSVVVAGRGRDFGTGDFVMATVFDSFGGIGRV